LIGDLIDEYPFLLEFLPTISPVFSKLQDEDMRQQMGKIATLDMVAQMGGIEVHDLLYSLSREIEKRSGEGVEREKSLDEGESEKKMDELKSIITELHSGKSVEDVKQRFLDLAVDVDSTEIARMEQELIEGGLPEEEIKKLCDVHVEVFKESLDKKEELGALPGHPVHTYMQENEVLDGLLAALSGLIKEISENEDLLQEKAVDIKRLLASISKLDLHYLRKENQLFPLLEKHNVSGPSQVMWALHDDIRKMMKEANVKVEMKEFGPVKEHLEVMIKTMKDMIYKEEKVLFPMSMDKLNEEEWSKVRRGEEEIGFAWIKSGDEWKPLITQEEKATDDQGKLRLDEGYMTLEQVNCMLKNLPLDISFVNDDNKVAYYSATEERIFPRSPAVIGRSVSKCHPPKSVHVVEKILEEFKAGNKDVAEFWIQLHGRFLHIRYFAVKNDEGNFLGTLEVSQDVTDIKSLEGEKRLLDWMNE
jgi:DUF438 domain-containing protein